MVATTSAPPTRDTYGIRQEVLDLFSSLKPFSRLAYPVVHSQKMNAD